MLFNLLTQEKNLCLYNKIRYFARERQRERDRETERHTQREKERQRERQRGTERDTERVALLILHRKQCYGFPIDPKSMRDNS